MSNSTKKIITAVPHRITGFFEIVDQVNGVAIKDPERIGSRGAGFCLSAIGRTEVILDDSKDIENNECQIYINGEKFDQKAETTFYIFNYIKKYVNKPLKVKIYHNFDLPVGCGYGASASGALGTILGLDYLLNLHLTYQEKGRIAHVAEVVNRTGLGTVCGLLGGGLCILKEPGYPCTYERLKIPKDIKIICGTMGAIYTKSVLTDPELNLRIKDAGRHALKKIVQNPNLKTFIDSSIEFVKRTNILDILNLTEVKELMNLLNNLDIYGASMNQLGRSVYAICTKKEENKVLEVFESFKPEIKIYNLTINKSRPIVLRK